MNTIDEILAKGRYTDRRRREWQHAWFGWWTPRGGVELPTAQMRLLIERDQHRDECRGVRVCQDHPVPRVFQFAGPFGHWSALGSGRSAANDSAHPTFPAAMDAARALAVGE